MSTWRPSKNCTYVISDIHGMYDELQLIFSRILPLRKTGKSFDKIIFLGDYIDRSVKSHMVIDILMELKANQPDQVIFLKGNHEQIFLDAISPTQTQSQYNMWMGNGGIHTLLGYLQRANSDIENPLSIPRKNIDVYIPKGHIDFIKNTIPYYEDNDFIFVHGGCDPFVPLKEQEENVLIWDRSVYNQILRITNFKQSKCPWEKTIVTGHSGNTEGQILVYDKFMMLDMSPAQRVCVLELNSMQCFSARHNKARLVKEPIT
jgi:serine/threonine protein phosphatase 1